MTIYSTEHLWELFDIPDRIVASGWHVNVPLARLLTRLLEPEIVVELGVHRGMSLCVFAETIKRYRLASRVCGVDTWQGDPQAGLYGDEVYEDLKVYVDCHYRDLCTLMKMSFDDALGEFASSTVDLLHIDGYHTYEAVSADYYTWEPKLSDSAVVLFHDVCVEREDFGVKGLFQELARKYPAVIYNEWPGLGILFRGQASRHLHSELTASATGASFWDVYGAAGVAMKQIIDTRMRLDTSLADIERCRKHVLYRVCQRLIKMAR